MRYQLFGPSGLRVSKLFLGAMTFGEQGGVGAPLDECRRIVNAYEDAGGNVIDTAINYRGGESETIVGELLVGRRDRFVVGTKYTVSRDRTDPNGAGNHRKNVRLSLEMSLRRLQSDYIDIYWVHIWDEFTPIDETMRALDDAVRAGKVLYIGLSDTPAWVVSRANTLAEWRGWATLAGLQVPYSLLQRDVERELLPVAEAYGMTLAAWSPLAGGILSGKFTGYSSPEDGTRIAPDTISDHDRAVAITVQEVAAELGASPAQVSIAWTMARSQAVCPIIGARRLDQLVDNVAALECKLPPEAMERLESVAGHIKGFPYDFLKETADWVFGAAAHAERPKL